MEKKQFYGIRYPFASNGVENYYLDVNHNLTARARSVLMHIIFTPKGQRIRDPEFGTDLIKYLFEPNDDKSWGDVENEIRSAVSRFAPYINIEEVSMATDDDYRKAFIKIKYSASKNGETITDSFVTEV